MPLADLQPMMMKHKQATRRSQAMICFRNGKFAGTHVHATAEGRQRHTPEQVGSLRRAILPSQVLSAKAFRENLPHDRRHHCQNEALYNDDHQNPAVLQSQAGIGFRLRTSLGHRAVVTKAGHGRFKSRSPDNLVSQVS
jgi:hypothetical protein